LGGHLEHLGKGWMKRGVTQPMKNDVIKATVIFHQTVQNVTVEVHVHRSLGNCMDFFPSLMVRCTHLAPQIAVVSGFNLENAIVDGLHGTFLDQWLQTRQIMTITIQ
jgi:hypothetical protein